MLLLATAALTQGCASTSPAPAKSSMVMGNVVFSQTISVPQGMPITITIVDMTDPAKPMMLASKTMVCSGQSTSFAIPVDPAMMKDGMKCQVQASAMMDGKMMMSHPITISPGVSQAPIEIMFTP
jgi:uncharacterized lipoprotein YbaY